MNRLEGLRNLVQQRFWGAAARDRSSLMVAAFALLCFLGGAASLNYQIAWQRVLTQAIGIDSYSVTLIVGLFMAGLGLGGYVGAWLLRREINAARNLGAIEVALGLFGLMSVPFIQWANAALVFAGASVELSLVVNFLILLFPTALMGITTPLMISLFAQRYEPSRATSIGYSANIAGAAVGTLVAGFLLIGTLGLTRTCVLMGGMDLFVGIAFLVIARRFSAVTLHARPRGVESSSVAALNTPTLFLACFIIGFVALGSEIVYFRLFTTYYGPTPYVFPTLLFAYLTNMAADT